MQSGWRVIFISLATLVSAACSQGPAQAEQTPQVVKLWPGAAPGTSDWTGPEQSADADLPNLGKVHVITNVTTPTLTVIRPPAGKANGTGIVLVPGGAFGALPWDLDGLESARWLTAHGITAFILKYRVRPPAPGTPPDQSFDDFAKRTKGARDIAVADAEQAMRVVRAHAAQFGVARDRIGMMGFSAGAMTTALAADAADPAVRPDFAVSLYGAWLAPTGPSSQAAPIFIVAAQDDPDAPPVKSTELFDRWTSARRPAELHLYEKGGHGFAFRHHGVPADAWPQAFEAWLAAHGYLTRAR